jgi:DNA-binding IclR family transcriptional regulator
MCAVDQFSVNMTYKRLSLELRAEIATQHKANGLSYGQLASMYSLSKSTVYNICQILSACTFVEELVRSILLIVWLHLLSGEAPL